MPRVVLASAFLDVECVGFPDIHPAAFGPLDPLSARDLGFRVDRNFIVSGRRELQEIVGYRSPCPRSVAFESGKLEFSAPRANGLTLRIFTYTPIIFKHEPRTFGQPNVEPTEVKQPLATRSLHPRNLSHMDDRNTTGLQDASQSTVKEPEMQLGFSA